MRKVLKIDKYGYFVEDEIFQNNEEVPADCIEVECPEGFYHARWDGEEWVEGLAQEEIDNLSNQPKPPPTAEERLEALENAMLEMVLGGGL